MALSASTASRKPAAHSPQRNEHEQPLGAGLCAHLLVRQRDRALDQAVETRFEQAQAIVPHHRLIHAGREQIAGGILRPGMPQLGANGERAVELLEVQLLQTALNQAHAAGIGLCPGHRQREGKNGQPSHQTEGIRHTCLYFPMNEDE
ncbi:hypothetical protein HUU39_21640 [candidate division KSB1 bacterium]|nr:hypothetical protein [candidate division KSB1 bacterium]